MRALAEFILRGRTQAIAVAVVAALLPMLFWLSAAAVSLVTLRKGAAKGSSIVVLALLPAIMWARQGDFSPFVVILGSYILAIVLRRTVSWQRCIQVALVLALTAGFLQQTLNAEVLQQVVNAVQKMITQTHPQAELSMLADKQWLYNAALGTFDTLYFAMMILSLLLARWWQSALFNPGGLQQEFHQLRFSPLFALALIATVLIATQGEEDIIRWGPVFMAPLVIAGLALAHGSVAKRNLGRSWLAVIYLAAFVFGPYVITVLVFFAVIDALVDIRKRIPARQ